MISINLDRSKNYLSCLTQLMSYNPFIICIQDLPKVSAFDLRAKLKAVDQNFNIILPQMMTKSSVCRNTAIIYDKTKVARSGKPRVYEGPVSCSYSELKLKIDGNRKVGLMSIYMRPNSNSLDIVLFSRIVSEIQSISWLVIMGDVNTSTIHWATDDQLRETTLGFRRSNKHFRSSYATISRKRGMAIAHFLHINRLTCLNNPSVGYTYVYEELNHRSQIDIIFAGLKISKRLHNFQLIEIPKFKHRAIKMDYLIGDGNGSSEREHDDENSRKQGIKLRNILLYKRLKEDLFDSLKIQTHDYVYGSDCDVDSSILRRNLDYLVDITCKHLYDIQTSITIQTKHLRGKKRIDEKLRRISKKIRRNKSINKNKINSNNSISSPSTSNIKTIREMLSCLWKKAANLKKDDANIKSQASSSNTNLNSMNSYLELNSVCEEKFPFVDLSFAKQIYQSMQPQNCYSSSSNHLRVSDAEFINAIEEIKAKTFTGSDNIKMKFFSRVTKYIYPILKKIADLSFRTCYTPRQLLSTKGILIPKKEANKFRIVHVTCCIAALLERIALHKLEQELQHRKLFNSNQYGFIARRNRMDVVARVLSLCSIETISNIHEPRSIIIGLDIEGAFDNVDLNYLINKLHHDLNDTPLKVWLTNFLLSRSITLYHKNFSSMKVDVMKGVPQGSSLGPILFNYSIRHVSSIDKSSELLAYADDLIIVHRGQNYNSLQMTIDHIVRQLGLINLKLNVSKCTAMHVSTAHNEFKITRKLYIDSNSEPIPSTKVTKILGVPITRRLKLYLKDKDIESKLLCNAKTLHKINKLKVIWQPNYWRVLIKSYIQSLTHNNYLPILAIDPSARKWAEKKLFSAIRFIFSWPAVTPFKIMKLIIGIESTNLMISRYLSHNIILNYDNKARDFKVLKAIFEEQVCGKANPLWYTNIDHNHSLLVDIDYTKPRYPNTSSFLLPATTSNIINQHLQVSQTCKTILSPQYDQHTWIVVEGGKESTAVLRLNGKNLKIITAFNSNFRASFFNTLSLLKFIVMDDTIDHKVAHINFKCSTYTALSNNRSRNWRIIKLRNIIASRKWVILPLILNDNEDINMYKDLKVHINQFKKIEKVKSHALHWPDVSQYSQVSKLKRDLTTLQEEYFSSLHNRITFRIEPDAKYWQTLNPNRFSSKHMLSLSGLYLREGVFFRDGMEDEPEFCSDCNVIEENSYIMHKALECPSKSDSLMEIYNKFYVKASRKYYKNNQELLNSKCPEIWIKDLSLRKLLFRLIARASNIGYIDLC